MSKTKTKKKPASKSAKALPNEMQLRVTSNSTGPETGPPEPLAAKVPALASCPPYYEKGGWDGVCDPPPKPMQLSPAEEAEGERLLDEYLLDLERKDILRELRANQSAEDRAHERAEFDAARDLASYLRSIHENESRQRRADYISNDLSSKAAQGSDRDGASFAQHNTGAIDTKEEK